MEGDVENEVEELAHMSYEDRVLRALEGKNDGIKIEVSDASFSLSSPNASPHLGRPPTNLTVRVDLLLQAANARLCFRHDSPEGK